MGNNIESYSALRYFEFSQNLEILTSPEEMRRGKVFPMRNKHAFYSGSERKEHKFGSSSFLSLKLIILSKLNIPFSVCKTC